MWIKRDLQEYLARPSLPVQVIWGPRQCGKSTLLDHLSEGWNQVTLDELSQRKTARQDPALFLAQNTPPVIVDEVQYAPELFSQIKLVVDQKRKAGPLREPLFRLTGSHQILLDTKIRESLGGRANFFRLHGFSLQEIQRSISIDLEEFIFRGAWPELAVDSRLSAVDFLNDYIRTVVEKDVALVSGIRELDKFQLAIGLLAARTGELLNFDSLGREAGISGYTLKTWVVNLERSGLAGLLRPYHSNLNKRLTKTPKFYFLDTGLAARLQGHTDPRTLFKSSAFGHLFETLVLTEILKTRDHHRKDWQLFFWRTKEGEEYDFIVQSRTCSVVLEAKVAVQSARAFEISSKLRRDLGQRKIKTAVCTFGGKQMPLSKECDQIPAKELAGYLLKNLE